MTPRYVLPSLLTLLATLSLVGCAATEAPADDLTPTPTPVEAIDPLDITALAPTDFLSGQLLLLQQRAQPAFGLTLFDLEDQSQRQVFQVPELAFLYDVDVVPGGSLMAISYSPPPGGDVLPYDRGGIYLLEDGGTPTLLTGAGESGEYTYQPQWQADGQALYLVGQGGRFDGLGESPILARVDREGKELECVATAASEPATSHEGESVAWIRSADGRSLWIRDEPGDEPRQLIGPDRFYDIGLPVFSRDDRWILFLVTDDPGTETACSSCRETGKASSDGSSPDAGPDSEASSTAAGQSAEAVAASTATKTSPAHADHSQPGKWWRVPVAGGEPEPITGESLTTWGVDVAVDGQWLATTTAEGLSVVDPTGAKAPQAIISSRSLRSVDWVAW